MFDKNLFAIIGIIFLVTVVIGYTYFQLKKSDDPTVASRLKNKLTDEHEKLLTGIRKGFKISDEDWDYFRRSHAYAQTVNPLGSGKSSKKSTKRDHPIIQVAKECLTDFGINPDRVDLRKANLEYTSAAANQNFTGTTTEHIIDLDFEKLSKKSRETQKAIIGHEIQHLIHYDPLEMAYITNLLEEYKFTPFQYSHKKEMIDYCHHIESRADLLASVLDIRVAEAFQDDFKQDMALSKSFHPETWITHPTDEKRYHQLGDLIASMKQETKIELA